MEIKINKEIRAYRETLFFGLSMRQFVCSVLAVGVAVTLYFSLSRVLDRETVSWVCIVGAAPVAAAGFFQYNGLTLEQFLWAWLKSEVIMAGKRVWKAENYYEEAMKRVLQTKVNSQKEKSPAKFARPKKGITKQAGEKMYRQPGWNWQLA